MTSLPGEKWREGKPGPHLWHYASMRRILFAFSSMIVAASQAQVVLNRMDTFTDGTVHSWGGGAAPTNIPTGGPTGLNDKYLQITTGIGGHLATYNIPRWSGNYTAAGVARIDADFKNTGAGELDMRLILHGPLGTRWSSNAFVNLHNGSGWAHFSWELKASDFTLTTGTATFDATLAALDRLMFREETTISAGGDFTVGQVGIDNVVGSMLFDFALSKSTVAGQNFLLGTVTMPLAFATPTVFTTFDNSSLVTTPPTATVNAGLLSKAFQIQTMAVNSTINTTVSARLGSLTRTQPLTLAPLIPTGMVFTPNPVIGGNTVSCRLVINGIAGPGGRNVSVFDNSAFAVTPSSVTVPAGASSVTFNITTVAVTSAKTVTVTATVSAGTKTANFRINP